MRMDQRLLLNNFFLEEIPNILIGFVFCPVSDHMSHCVFEMLNQNNIIVFAPFLC